MRKEGHAKTLGIVCVASTLCVGYLVANTFLPRLRSYSGLVAVPTTFHIGSVGEGGVARGRVRIENRSDHSLTIQSITTSCGCTAADALNTLPAHGSADLALSYDTRGRPGAIDSQVTVVTNEHPNQPLIIPLTGQVVPIVRVEPARIELGDVPPDETRPFNLTIRPVGDQAIHVHEVRADGPLRAHVVGEVLTPPAPPMRIVGTLIAPRAAGEYHKSIIIRLDDALHTDVVVPVRFTVPSAYAVTPRELNFGVLTTRTVSPSTTTTAERVVRLEGNFPNGLRVEKAPSGFTVALRRDTPRVFTMSARLLPAGRRDDGSVLTDQVVLATGNARQPKIIVPVYAAFSTSAADTEATAP